MTEISSVKIDGGLRFIYSIKPEKEEEKPFLVKKIGKKTFKYFGKKIEGVIAEDLAFQTVKQCTKDLEHFDANEDVFLVIHDISPLKKVLMFFNDIGGTHDGEPFSIMYDFESEKISGIDEENILQSIEQYVQSLLESEDEAKSMVYSQMLLFKMTTEPVVDDYLILLETILDLKKASEVEDLDENDKVEIRKAMFVVPSQILEFRQNHVPFGVIGDFGPVKILSLYNTEDDNFYVYRSLSTEIGEFIDKIAKSLVLKSLAYEENIFYIDMLELMDQGKSELHKIAKDPEMGLYKTETTYMEIEKEDVTKASPAIESLMSKISESRGRDNDSIGVSDSGEGDGEDAGSGICSINYYDIAEDVTEIELKYKKIARTFVYSLPALVMIGGIVAGNYYFYEKFYKNDLKKMEMELKKLKKDLTIAKGRSDNLKKKLDSLTRKKLKSTKKEIESRYIVTSGQLNLKDMPPERTVEKMLKTIENNKKKAERKKESGGNDVNE